MSKDVCPPARVDLAMVDAGFCLLESRMANRDRLVAEVYRKTGNLVSRDRAIVRAITTARRKFSRELLDDDYWLHVNLAVMRVLDPTRRVGNQAAAAERIHARLLSDRTLFKVQTTLLAVIRRLRQRGARVVIASNQQELSLRKLLEHFDLLGEVDAIYTSERLGVRKPNRQFWETILEEESVSSDHAIHIGNSMRSDVGAATVGICTAIWDAKGELEKCRQQPSWSIPGLNLEETDVARKNLDAGRIVPFISPAALRRCMEERGLI